MHLPDSCTTLFILLMLQDGDGRFPQECQLGYVSPLKLRHTGLDSPPHPSALYGNAHFDQITTTFKTHIIHLWSVS